MKENSLFKIFRATHVPVGQDQIQHIQLSEHLAQKFNSSFGETLPMPIAIINGNENFKNVLFQRI